MEQRPGRAYLTKKRGWGGFSRKGRRLWDGNSENEGNMREGKKSREDK